MKAFKLAMNYYLIFKLERKLFHNIKCNYDIKLQYLMDNKNCVAFFVNNKKLERIIIVEFICF